MASEADMGKEVWTAGVGVGVGVPPPPPPPPPPQEERVKANRLLMINVLTVRM
jgi:hypothetical protein